MIKLLTIIGARPQIIKASAISRAIQSKFESKINEIIVHTGQHYDDEMSNVFFDELSIPEPKYNLNVGSGSHGQQTAKMIDGLESIVLKEKFDGILVYGDTNSTLAGAIVGSKLHIPIFHIESGLRSFNKKMPEEINRIVTDQCSTLLFTPTMTGKLNLQREGFNFNEKLPISFDNPAVYHSGDVMLDNSLFFAKFSIEKSQIIKELEVQQNNFILCTIHRDTNTDDPTKLKSIFEALIQIINLYEIDVILPLHPRTRKMILKIEDNNFHKLLEENKKLKMVNPLGFYDIIELERNSKLIITDSGGVQKEAYFFGKQCVILREQSEWVEIIENGCALLAGSDKKKILESTEYFIQNPKTKFPSIFGDGKASEFILNCIKNYFENKN